MRSSNHGIARLAMLVLVAFVMATFATPTTASAKWQRDGDLPGFVNPVPVIIAGVAVIGAFLLLKGGKDDKDEPVTEDQGESPADHAEQSSDTENESEPGKTPAKGSHEAPKSDFSNYFQDKHSNVKFYLDVDRSSQMNEISKFTFDMSDYTLKVGFRYGF